MSKNNVCLDCQNPCDKRSKRCQTCSNKINGKSRIRNAVFCEKCKVEITKKKYKLCHSCNMKDRWADESYAKSTIASMKDSFDSRWADPVTRSKIVKILTSFSGSSKLEKSVAKIAAQFGFESSIVIGRYLADLANENKKIIVEVNGDLWHCNPMFWKSYDVHPNKKIPAQQIWDKDFKRKEYLESMGYKVYVLWEYDILNNKDKYIIDFFERIIK